MVLAFVLVIIPLGFVLFTVIAKGVSIISWSFLTSGPIPPIVLPASVGGLGPRYSCHIDNPPINVMGPEMVRHFQEVINALEADEQVRVVVFDSAVDDYFLNHSDFLAKLEDLTAMPAGPTGLPPWPDFLVRLTRVPVVSIALIRGRATGNGSEITLACDMSFASREKAIISQWEVGVGWSRAVGPWLGCRNSSAETAPLRYS